MLFEQHCASISAPGGTEWSGDARDVALSRAVANLSVVRQQAEVQRRAAEIAASGAGDVRAAQRAVLNAIGDVEADGFIVNDDFSVIDAIPSLSSDDAAARLMLGTEHAEYLRWLASNLSLADALVGRRLQQEATDLGAIRFDGEAPSSGETSIQAVDYKLAPPTPIGPDADKRRNEAEAFKRVFGRAPSTTGDWKTAAALDPHSYDPRLAGVSPEIKVVRIEPVPGQGVVRASQWIEQRDVISGPFKRDFGNARVSDPQFDPADTKVTTYVDYENGLVVVRQNPSIELDASGGPGQVKVGVPEALVQQTSDGAVRIKYDAGNPFAPDIARNPPWPLTDNPWTVNGDLVFTPTNDGIQVSGTRTNYPSMEVYQDLPNGQTQTILIDPAIAGNSTGPMVNLPEHHDVGIGGRAFGPFDAGGWNPKYDVPIPFPSTAAGPPEHPPSVFIPPRQGTQI